MSSIANNIHAEARTLSELLGGKKYEVDYFQREYKWEQKHIEQLLTDLEAAFLANYHEDHAINAVNTYNCYYMGPIVICDKKVSRSIVDGQQRLTSMTLLLIYLNNLQKDNSDPEDLERLIYSKKHGKKSYNIEVPDRTPILEALFFDQDFKVEDENDESVKNMYERYCDIKRSFSEELKSKLPLFIDWIKEKIVFVEIVAYSDENAYTIFETMNDRGLNLTSTEMLKSFILSNVKDVERVGELNELWKKQVSKLHSYSPIEDLEFVKAWLRSVYAETIRSSVKGAENEDFERIGTRFHTWVRDNLKKIGLRDSDSFYYFVKGDFNFYFNVYCKIKDAQTSWTEPLTDLFITSYWNIASSLSFPLFLAPINKLDDESTIIQKINLVARFLDVYSVKRVLHDKSITQNSIRYFIYTLVKEVRNKGIEELRDFLRDKLKSMDDTAWPITDYLIYRYDRKFIRYLFARMTYYIEMKHGRSGITFEELMATRKRARYVLVEMISFEFARKQIDEKEAFMYSSYLGNMLLIPFSISQEFEETENISKLQLVRNTNILSSSVVRQIEGLSFDPIKQFSFQEVSRRQEYIMNLIAEIWSVKVL